VGYGEVLGDKSTMCIRVILSHFLKHSFGFIVYRYTYGCMFFVLLFNFVNDLFLLCYILLLLLYVFLLPVPVAARSKA
jgi:hypothetical protein